MLSYAAARDRAIRRAVETGQLAEMEFIHTVQAAEGFQPCFGRAEEPCDRFQCRWHAECDALCRVAMMEHEAVFA